MCSAIALPTSELPDALLATMLERIHSRGEGEREVRFYLRAVPALLPVWWGGRLRVVRWGNRDRSERRLPPTAWTWQATVETGAWSEANAEPVDIPGRFLFANGVWTTCKRGVRGLLCRPPGAEPVAYAICQPATRYWEVMTRADWMPVLIDEVI